VNVRLKKLRLDAMLIARYKIEDDRTWGWAEEEMV